MSETTLTPPAETDTALQPRSHWVDAGSATEEELQHWSGIAEELAQKLAADATVPMRPPSLRRRSSKTPDW